MFGVIFELFVLANVLKEAGDLGFGHLELGFAEELGELGIEFDEVIA